MDGDDDDVSFLSISDSDVESESVDSHFNDSQFFDFPRADSPAASVSSCRSLRQRSTPKRMAPQPPSAPIPLCVADPQKFKAAPSTFRQVFQKRITGTQTLVAPIPIKNIGAIASHPIQILPLSTTPKDSGLAPITGAGKTQNERAQHPSVVDGTSGDFSRLQIRLIDDEPEIIETATSSPATLPPSAPVSLPPSTSATLSSSAPVTLGQDPSSAQLTSICTVSEVPVFSQELVPSSTEVSLASPVYYTSSINISQTPNAALANPDPVMTNLSSPVQPPNSNIDLPYTNFPISSPPVYLPNSQHAYFPGQYVGLSAFGVMPQSSNDVLAATTSNYSIQTNYRLSHSASEPGLVRVIGRVPDSFPQRIRRLESLSEEEEEEDSVFSDDNSAAVEYSDQRRSRCRVSRSNSNVTVAHLYEDLLVSSRFNLKVTLTNLTVVVVLAAFFVPNSSAMIFNAFRLIFGTLFPAYYSYKAVRTKNVKEYVKWMMYWIVFAFFTCIETITDVFLSFWFPFYYEIKILVVLWLLSPATRGSSILYRKFVHPWLTRREEEIDDCIAKAKQQGYSTVVQLGTKGVNYATTVIMQTAIKGGGGLVSQLKRSYSASEIGEDVADMNRNVKALPPKEERHRDVVIMDDDDRSVSSGSHESEIRTRSESESSSHRIRGHSTGRAVRAAKTRSADVSDVHYLDVSDGTPQRRSPRTHDVMSTSAVVGGNTQTVMRRSRTGDVSSYATLPRTTAKRVGTAKKKQV